MLHLLEVLRVDLPQLVHRVRDAAHEGAEDGQTNQHHDDGEDALRGGVRRDVLRGGHELRQRPVERGEVLSPEVLLLQVRHLDPGLRVIWGKPYKAMWRYIL